MNEDKVETMRQMVREARLKVTPEAEEQLAREVVELLHNVDILAEVEVGEGIQRLTLSPEELRADEPHQPSLKEEALTNAPDSQDGFVVVPRVLPGEDESNA
jgi:aspartyl-tRNA(Asn)/glutamyl-tRNA(Gln) amidotransferase subunit C